MYACVCMTLCGQVLGVGAWCKGTILAGYDTLSVCCAAQTAVVWGLTNGEHEHKTAMKCLRHVVPLLPLK